MAALPQPQPQPQPQPKAALQAQADHSGPSPQKQKQKQKQKPQPSGLGSRRRRRGPKPKQAREQAFNQATEELLNLIRNLAPPHPGMPQHVRQQLKDKKRSKKIDWKEVLELKEKGADVTARVPSKTNKALTIIHLASRYASVAVLGALLDGVDEKQQKACLNARTKIGTHVPFFAVCKDSEPRNEVVAKLELFQSLDADFNMRFVVSSFLCVCFLSPTNPLLPLPQRSPQQQRAALGCNQQPHRRMWLARQACRV